MLEQSRTPAVDWDDVRFFVALARAGSLSAASRSLRVDHATVGRRVVAMERALGQPLFERRRDGYALTEHGQRLLPAALAMEEAAATIADGLGADVAGGTVRLATLRSLADSFLADRLGALMFERPGPCLEIVTDVHVVSLARRDADIALRLGRPADGGLVGRRIADIRYAYYTAQKSVDVARRADGPAIGFRSDETGVVEAAWIERRFADRRLVFRADSNVAQARAALAGVGVAMLPRYLGVRHSGLVEVDLGQAHPPRELWLVSPGELARTPRIRAVLDTVAEAVRLDRRELGW